MWNAVSESCCEATIEDVHRAYRGGAITARQLTEAYLQRISELDPILNSIVTVNLAALDEAGALDAKLHSGPALVGPLHGIPIVVKDQAETAGLATAFGSHALRDYVPKADATAVARLRAAGAIVIGKAAMPDFATSWHGHSSRSGVTRNPYALDRDPGGSSSGTAAAVAADFALLGLGEDTGGSLRVPASFCGLVGLRTSTGLISRAGFSPLVREQDAPGPLTRTVRDLAITLDVLAGWDPEDPFTAAAAVVRQRGTFSDQLHAGGLTGARLGVLRECFGATEEAEQEVTPVMAAALERLEGAGAVLVDPVTINRLEAHLAATFPYFLQSRRALNAFFASRSLPVADVTELVQHREHWPSLVLLKLIAAGPREPESMPEYAQLLESRAAFQRAVVGAMAAHGLDALVYPTAKIAAPRRADIDAGCWEETEDGAAPRERRPFPVNVMIASQALLPAISLPVGSTPNGLPVGLELLGMPYDDVKLVHLAFDVERSAGARVAPALEMAIAHAG